MLQQNAFMGNRQKLLLHLLWAGFPQSPIHRQFGEEKLHSRSVQNQAAVKSGERGRILPPIFLLPCCSCFVQSQPSAGWTLLKCRNQWFPYFIAHVFKNAFVLLPYSWRGRDERQAGRKSRHVAQNCIWGGALLMLVLNMWLFSALSSWGVLAGSDSKSSSQVPYVSWRCLSSGLV